MDDARLYLVDRMRAVAAGDKGALGDIYERTCAKLFGVCLRILSSREEAEDVLQDVYLTVWNKAETFDPARASPITWLATIARNRAIDRQRAIGPRRGDAPVEEACGIADLSDDALARLEKSDEARRLHACLGRLDGRSRRVILAAFYGGRTYEDLATEDGTPLGTMKSVVRRGLIRLKGCLDG